jgi:hypothetical protein
MSGANESPNYIFVTSFLESQVHAYYCTQCSATWVYNSHLKRIKLIAIHFISTGNIFPNTLYQKQKSI